MLDLQSNNQLSKNELREIAPSIFSTKPSPEVSKKYSRKKNFKKSIKSK